MKKTVNKNLKTLLIITLFIILFASLEALVNAKSIEALNNYKVAFPDHSNQDYINFILLTYIFNIIEPIAISLYLFFTYNKIKPNKLYSIVFGGMILIKLINNVLTFNINSIFYYIILILYFLLLIFVVKYGSSMEERR
ncbi:MAG: hypothetical protein GX666_11655 [Tissierellia bacterium]|nr:hypothetical protein [Tissierellia bacterium]